MPPPHRPDSAGSTRQRRTGVGGDSGSDTHSASTKGGTYCGSLHTRDKASRQGPATRTEKERPDRRCPRPKMACEAPPTKGTTRSTMPATEDGLRGGDEKNQRRQGSHNTIRSGGDAINAAGHQPATGPLDRKREQVKEGQRRPGTKAGDSDCPE